jgi:hypothetical protein
METRVKGSKTGYLHLFLFSQTMGAFLRAKARKNRAFRGCTIAPAPPLERRGALRAPYNPLRGPRDSYTVICYRYFIKTPTLYA